MCVAACARVAWESHALLHACAADARLVQKATSGPKLVVLSPLLASASGDHSDCLVVNWLPFEQDLRWTSFPPLLAKEDMAPRCVCVNV